MYEERWENGTRKYSQAQIAKTLGVSETTIFRALNKLGAYVRETDDLTKPATPEQSAAATRSVEIFKKILAEEGKPKETKKDGLVLDWDTLTLKPDKKEL